MEAYLGRALITRTLALDLAGFPAGPLVARPGPVQAIQGIEYVARDGTTASIAAYQTRTILEGAEIWPVPGQTWPLPAHDHVAPVTLTWRAGYGDTADTVPHAIRQGILRVAGGLYDGRAPDTPAVPETTRTILYPYRVPRLV